MAKGPYVQYVQYRVEGTSARKVEVLTPTAEPLKQTQPLPRIRKIRRRLVFVDPVVVLGITMAVILLAMMCVGLNLRGEALQELETMQENVNTLVQQNLTLSQQYSEKYNLRDIEQTALALGMVPCEDLNTTVIDISFPQQEEASNVWEQIGAFFTGLFA